MRHFLLSLATALLLLAVPGLALAQATATDILNENRALIEKPTRAKIAPVIDALAASGDPVAAAVLAAWAEKGLGLRKADGTFFLIEASADGQFDIVSQTEPVAGDAWTDFLPESAVLESDWAELDCGMYNTETKTCVQIKSNY